MTGTWYNNKFYCNIFWAATCALVHYLINSLYDAEVDNVIVPILYMRKWFESLYDVTVSATSRLELFFLHLWREMVTLNFKLFVLSNWKALATSKVLIWCCLKCSLQPLFPLAMPFKVFTLYWESSPFQFTFFFL